MFRIAIRNVLGSTEWSRMIPEHSRMVLSDHNTFGDRCWKDYGTSGKLFRDFRKCSGRFRKVLGSLWKYPEGYGTLQDAETEARPSRKVHKVVGQREIDFPWGPGHNARVLGVSPLDAAGRGVSYWNPCWTPPGGQNRLWGEPSPKLRPQASTYIFVGRGSPKDTPEKS